ncbi:PKD domain-containing protein [Halorussus amylolyticus]|uniref:PKD domain-containing protein n=1 Tax=Halorussus amylolyticus TaxID=1126242 RepID=UPI00138EF63A|nr:PKD domain-containing protein [Halorussus amylolyticus]
MTKTLLSVLLVVVAPPPRGGGRAGGGRAAGAPPAAGSVDGLHSLDETTHGADALDGSSASAQPIDVNDSELPERWNATVGGDGDDKLTTGVKTDGGYLVVGWTDSGASDDADDGYAAMVDESGQTTWERSYGGSGTDRLFDVEEVEDGYVLAGFTSGGDAERNAWTLKIDDSGDTEWERTYGDDDRSAFWSLETSGDSIYAGGWQKEGNAEALLMELDSDGDEEWSQTYDTLRSGSDEYLNSIFVTDGGDLLLTGTIESDTYDPSDGWVLKVDSEGDEKWSEEYGGTDVDRVHDAAAAPDGGFVLAGRTASHADGEQDGWLLKIDGSGETEWERTYGSDKDDAFYGVLSADGGYVLTGAKHKLGDRGADGWMVRTDGDGKKQWDRTFGQQYWDKFWPAIDGHGGGYLALGDTTSYSENQDGWLVRVGGPASAAIQDADESESGTTVSLRDSPVRSVTLPESNVSGVLTVSERADLSDLSPPGDPVYAVDVTGPESAANDSATVELSVPTEDRDADDLRIARQTADDWDVLETEVVSEDNETAVLSAETNGTSTLAVTEVAAPTAEIGGDEVVTVGESASLNADESSAENATLERYEWSIDGETDDGETTDVSFDDPGEREVSLTVTDSAGLRDTATATLVVNDRPEVDVETPDSLEVGSAATFAADVTDEVGETTVTWRFGDGEVTGESVEHSFGSPGTHTVEVVVEDEYGATATEELSVEVASQGDEDAEPTDTTTDDTDQTSSRVPGFGVTAAVVALLAAALVARRLT